MPYPSGSPHYADYEEPKGSKPTWLTLELSVRKWRFPEEFYVVSVLQCL